MTDAVLTSDPSMTGHARHQFAPRAGWINDPNGLVYLDGEYHLFYQHNPHQRVWGSMYWGHAVSRDLVSWEELPIALEPDELGDIFSGSVVADVENRTGLSRHGETVLIAFFTHHDAGAKAAGRRDYECQSMALSHDKGRTWIKSSHNPILSNPGDTPDFRDPCVFWHAESSSWIMLLAAGDRIKVYRSDTLLDWVWASDFDAGLGSQLGLWECPSLFTAPIENEAKTRWVLLQSFHPGGLYGGSGTQYFVGDFDGFRFQMCPAFAETLGAEGPQWLDWGPDNYASICWANLPQTRPRPLIVGWMNNWAYANDTLETPARGRMTCPRELSIRRDNGVYRLGGRSAALAPRPGHGVQGSTLAIGEGLQRIDLAAHARNGRPAIVELMSGGSTMAVIEFDHQSNAFIIDRSRAHPAGRSDGLAARFSFPRRASTPSFGMSLYVSRFGLELFIDDGLQTATTLLDPTRPIDAVTLRNLRFL